MIPEFDSDALETELARLRDAELSREQIDEILHQLGKIIGLEDLALDEQGVAELTVDDAVELSLIHLNNFPGLVAAVAMPEGMEGDARVLRKLLQVNMAWSLTQGGAFVFVPPQLALCRLIPLMPGDGERLDRELATFVALGKAWHVEIKNCQASITPDAAIENQADEDFVGLKV